MMTYNCRDGGKMMCYLQTRWVLGWTRLVRISLGRFSVRMMMSLTSPS